MHVTVHWKQYHVNKIGQIHQYPTKKKGVKGNFSAIEELVSCLVLYLLANDAIGKWHMSETDRK